MVFFLSLLHAFSFLCFSFFLLLIVLIFLNFSYPTSASMFSSTTLSSVPSLLNSLLASTPLLSLLKVSIGGNNRSMTGRSKDGNLGSGYSGLEVSQQFRRGTTKKGYSHQQIRKDVQRDLKIYNKKHLKNVSSKVALLMKNGINLYNCRIIL